MPKNLNQNKKLSELPGWYLPMFMNGQMKVTACDKSPADKKEAEAKLGMVAEKGGEYR